MHAATFGDTPVSQLQTPPPFFSSPSGTATSFLLPGYSTIPAIPSANTTILHVVVTNAAGIAVCNNTVLYTAPKNLQLPAAKVDVVVGQGINADGTVDVTVKADHVALFVTLTTLAHGRFSDNAFLLLPGSRTLRFVPFGTADLALLTSSIRVEHVATYM